MARVRNSARVNHHTVTAVSKRGRVAAPDRPQKRKSTPMVPSAASTILVDPRVWEAARGLAGGDMGRVQVLGPEEVIVWNDRNWRKRRGAEDE